MKTGLPYSMATLTVLSMGAPATLAQPESGLQLEEVMVTAQRREQSLQDVPIQVAAFSDQAIQDAGISTTEDFINLVPNVGLDDSFTYLNTLVTVRGVAQINNADSPVAIIIDGVPQNNQKQFKMNLFDVERIEVLKGPQGALYGRNAIGGAINIITRAPGEEVNGFAQVRYGEGSLVEVTGGFTAPISDKVGLRLAGLYKEDDGRLDNDFLGEKVDYVDKDYNVRARLTVEPSDWLYADFRIAYNEFEAGGIYDSIVDSGDANDYQPNRANLMGVTFGDVLDASMKLDFQTGLGTITAITGYSDLGENYRGDFDFGNPVTDPGGFFGLGFQAGQGQDLSVEILSQELRLTSPDENRLRYILGVYGIQKERTLLTRAFIDLNGTLDQIDTTALRLITLSEDNDNFAYAVFGEVSYDINQQLTLSGALRYDRDEREQTDVSTGAEREEDFDAWQPKVTLNWQLAPAKLAYATYSTGFRSGGFNAPTVGMPVFKDEYLDNYEIGFKTAWLNNRLIVNGAAFYTDVDDFQFFFVEGATASQIISNIDEVDIFGVELEMQAVLTEGLQVFAGLGTADSEIKQISVFPGNEGNHTPKTTEWTFNAGFQYRTPLGNGLTGMARMDYEHRGDKHWQVDNLDVQDPLDLISARVGIESSGWSVTLWGRNITDEEYYADYNSMEFSGLPYDIGWRAQPRAVGIEGRVNF
ncbi:TonB-dependent receptor [Kineobactrum salinum]|uniref:TonB-dependent receptor n=1 Tax=Kineobactrum salinum TaxID=2708301 RepID=A0A6C0U8W7_9GAMM|nr:TonB-dependent receptor [Kineobactrum salinum]QIB67015.1 TonB-dependent receptor [Kineobactrum salinum]